MDAGRAPAGTFLIGGALDAAAIALTLWLLGRAALLLTIGFALAWVVWTLASRAGLGGHPRRVAALYTAAVALQAAHFAEEYATGFQREFPAMWGYTWTDSLFLWFNAAALGVFALAAAGAWKRIPLAGLFVWVMAVVAGIGNGLSHPILSVVRGGYFPGTVTAVLHLVLGALLLRQLLQERPGRRRVRAAAR